MGHISFSISSASKMRTVFFERLCQSCIKCANFTQIHTKEKKCDTILMNGVREGRGMYENLYLR